MQRDSDELHDEISDLLKPYVRAEVANADLFGEWLQQQLDDGRDHQGIVSQVAASLILFRNTLEAVSFHNIAPESGSWNMHVDNGIDSHDLRIIVTLPGPEKEKIEVVAKDRDELEFLRSDKCLGYMIKVWRGLSQSLDKLTIYAQRCRELKAEEAELSHPAQGTVQNHINLLKEYNDVKDIGQQVIGLIAENKGVQIGKLYENGDYGVTADD
ncbi:Swi5-domain-containing protein [Cercophora samala]|uniref:Swi5-domain-containing protein n=1 Tax=Cercophora samala TaxID=330535 RepID=A0AA40DAX8_9PEZI|nr:Swi5-domain-containing protein [Cercophora samala]